MARMAPPRPDPRPDPRPAPEAPPAEPRRPLHGAWHDLRDGARGLLVTAGPFILLATALVALAYWLLQPQPPRRLVMATGIERSAYERFAQRYAELLRPHGITVELRPTAGAAQNLALLRDPASGVDVAFVQGGAEAGAEGNAASADGGSPAATPANGRALVSLGRMFHEPVWLFYRRAAALDHLGQPGLQSLSELAGWSLNIGEPGSGVPPLMQHLLEANRVDPARIALSQQPVTPAVVELIEGRLDALVLASAPESQMVQMLLQTPGVTLFDFVQAEAYARRFAFLQAVTLPRGVVDLAADRPPRDVHLVAATATLLARADLHPALVQLLVQTAQAVHGGSGWFQRKGEFPNPQDAEHPLSPEAERIYRQGPPWLQHYLPFWLANLADRMWVALLAIVAVLIPLSRVLPPLYEFRIRRRVFRWYAQLRQVEAEAGSAQATPAELQRRLDEIEAHLARVRVPLSHADELYALKAHIALVRERVAGRSGAAAAAQVLQGGAHAAHRQPIR